MTLSLDSVEQSGLEVVRSSLLRRELEDRLVLLTSPARTALEAAANLHVEAQRIARSVLVLIDTEPAIVVSPGDHRVNLKWLRRLLGAVSSTVAPGSRVSELSGYSTAGVSPFNDANAIPVLIDSRLGAYDTVFVAAGTRWHMAELSLAELVRLTDGCVVDVGFPMRLPSFIVDSRVKQLGVTFGVGIVVNTCTAERDPRSAEIMGRWLASLDSLGEVRRARIGAYRDALTRVGSSDSPSPELLLNYLERRGRLPSVNVIVDLYNTYSAVHGIVLSAHDLGKLAGIPRLMIADEPRTFHGLGSNKPQLVQTGEWFCEDDRDVLCRLNVKQGDESKVTSDTESLLLYAQGTVALASGELNCALYEVAQAICTAAGGRFAIGLDAASRLWPAG